MRNEREIRFRARVRVSTEIDVGELDVGETLEVGDGGAVGGLDAVGVEGSMGGLEVEIGGLEGGDGGEEGRN